MKVNSSIFKSYDIRGIYHNEINEKIAYQIGRGFATFLLNEFKKKKIKVVVGRDMRLSSFSLSKALKKGLIDSGMIVIDIGLASTPTFYFAVLNYKYDAGIQISASHNPKEYNGFKMVKNTFSGLLKIGKNSGIEELKDIVVSGRFINENKKGIVIKKSGVLNDEIKKLFKIIKPNRKKSLKIVADAANAMGALDLNALFKKLPHRLIKMNFKLDGSFPVHEPNPLKFETLSALKNKLLEEKADLGIAPDGDGDRVFFINEKGEVIPASHITALLTSEVLKKYPGEKIAFDIRYKWTPQKVIIDNKGKPVIVPVGHALITQAMREENIVFAGESSGHYFFRETGFSESTLLVILMVLEIMISENKKISEIINPLVDSFESGEMNFELKNREEIEEKFTILKKIYKNGIISEFDGLAIEYKNWRFSLRVSNTEPLVRLNVEAKDKKTLTQKLNEIKNILNS